MTKWIKSIKLVLYILLVNKWFWVYSRDNESELQTKKVEKTKVQLYSNYPFQLSSNSYTLNESGKFLHYKFNDDTKCTKVKYDGKDVWKYNSQEHDDKYPNYLYINSDLAYVDFQPFYYAYRFDFDKWVFDEYLSFLPTSTSQLYVNSQQKKTFESAIKAKQVEFVVPITSNNMAIKSKSNSQSFTVDNSVKTSDTVKPVDELKSAVKALMEKASNNLFLEIENKSQEFADQITSFIDGEDEDYAAILLKYSQLAEECHKIDQDDRNEIAGEYLRLYMAYKTCRENGWKND